MSHFKYHVFICNKHKSNNKGCGSKFPVLDAITYLKEKTKALGITGIGKTRISETLCPGRCTKGPIMVIYPEAIWYHYDSYEDLQEIIDSHLLNEKIVDRLMIPDGNAPS